MADLIPKENLNVENVQSTEGSGRAPVARLELAGEMCLLFACGAFFFYMLADSLGWIGSEWYLEASLVPWMFISLGTVMLLARVVQLSKVILFRHSERDGSGGERREIMDVGFEIGNDPKAAARRFAGIAGAIAVLFIGILLISVHAALPLWVFVFMYWVGGASLRTSLIVAGGLLAVILGVYDYVLVTRWQDPLLFEPPWRHLFA